MITPAQLKAVFKACRNPGIWCRTFDRVVDEFELRPVHRLAMWLAQCGYESSSFNVLRELMSYRTVTAVRAAFPRELPTDDVAQRYVMNPNGLACFVYANRDGNGDVASGDGFKYRGGGLIQLTGKANYEAAGKALNLDLVLRPKQIENEMVAARTAGYFWKLKDLNAAADAGDFDHTTRAINGPGMRGADERRKLWQALLVQLTGPSAQEAAVAARRAVPPVIDGAMDPQANRNLGIAEAV